MPHRITLRSLRALGACAAGLEAFRAACPRGLTVATTPAGRARQAARLAATLGDRADWYAYHTDARTADWSAYDAAIADARAARNAADADAWATYREASAAAWAAPTDAYDAAIAAAGAAYDAAIVSAWGTYRAASLRALLDTLAGPG